MGFENTLYKYLRACNIDVSKTFLEGKVKSLPFYPDRITINEIFDELGLETKIIKATKENIPTLTYPFLGGVNSPEAFEIVGTPKYITDNNGFLSRWNGIVLILNPGQTIADYEHAALLKNEKLLKRYKNLFFAFALLFYILTSVLSFDVFLFFFSFTSLSGICASYLIVQQLTGGYDSYFWDFIRSKPGNCDLVLQSKRAKFFGDIHIAEVSLVYFTALFLFSFFNILISPLIAHSRPLLLISCSIASPVVGYYLWYQWKVIKTWCILCVAIAVIALLQCGLLFGGFFYQFYDLYKIDLSSLSVFGLCFIAASSTLLLKSWLMEKKIATHSYIELLKWKRNPFVFQSILNKQERIQVPPPMPLFTIGNPAAPLKFTVILAPFCMKSAETFRQIKHLYDFYPELICFTIIFRVMADKKSDRRTIAVEHMISALLLEEEKAKLLENWYLDMDLKKWSAEYSLKDSDVNVDHLLKFHQEAAALNTTRVIPSIILNGLRFPEQYLLADLRYMGFNKVKFT